MAFFFFRVCHAQKKVGVPADLSFSYQPNKRRCEGWRSHPRAIRDDSRAILGSCPVWWCDQLHKSLGAKEKGAVRRPKLNEFRVLS